MANKLKDLDWNIQTLHFAALYMGEIELFRIVGSLFINVPPTVRTSPLSIKLTSVMKHYKA
jgi:hypothetical protein